MLAQRGEDGHSLGDREEAGDVAHGVGRRADADSAVGLGLLVSAQSGTRVEAVADLAGKVRDAAVAGSGELVGELKVDLHPILAGEQRGLPHYQRGAPLADPSAGQCVEGAGEVAHQAERDTEVLLAAGRWLAPGQGDLGGDAARDLGDRLEPRSSLAL